MKKFKIICLDCGTETEIEQKDGSIPFTIDCSNEGKTKYIFVPEKIFEKQIQLQIDTLYIEMLKLAKSKGFTLDELIKAMEWTKPREAEH